MKTDHRHFVVVIIEESKEHPKGIQIECVEVFLAFFAELLRENTPKKKELTSLFYRDILQIINHKGGS